MRHLPEHDLYHPHVMWYGRVEIRWDWPHRIVWRFYTNTPMPGVKWILYAGPVTIWWRTPFLSPQDHYEYDA